MHGFGAKRMPGALCQWQPPNFNAPRRHLALEYLPRPEERFRNLTELEFSLTENARTAACMSLTFHHAALTPPDNQRTDEVSAHPEEFSACTSVRLQSHPRLHSLLSMTHYSSAAAIGRPFTRKLNQSGLIDDSQHPRYAPCSRFLTSFFLNRG